MNGEAVKAVCNAKLVKLGDRLGHGLRVRTGRFAVLVRFFSLAKRRFYVFAGVFYRAKPQMKWRFDLSDIPGGSCAE